MRSELDRVPPSLHVIYVGMGSCGEYSDHREWPVAWRHTPEDAEQFKTACDEEARLYCDSGEKYDYKRKEDARRTMLDPHFDEDGEPPHYFVVPIPDDPQALAAHKRELAIDKARALHVDVRPMGVWNHSDLTEAYESPSGVNEHYPPHPLVYGVSPND